ncbi:MAG: CHRD domain-containing protein [Pirellula sp.]
MRFPIRFVLSLMSCFCAIQSYSLGAIIVFNGTFSALNENPPNASVGTGTAIATLDDVAKTLRLQATFSGLTGTVTQSHIHATASPGANAGIAVGNTSLPSFPLGVTSGTYDQTLDLNLQSVYNTNFFTNNGGTTATVSDAFITAMKSNRTYFNIHTSTVGGGEVRANLITSVPEPSSLALLGLSIAAISIGYRRVSKKR